MCVGQLRILHATLALKSGKLFGAGLSDILVGPSKFPKLVDRRGRILVPMVCWADGRRTSRLAGSGMVFYPSERGRAVSIADLCPRGPVVGSPLCNAALLHRRATIRDVHADRGWDSGGNGLVAFYAGEGIAQNCTGFRIGCPHIA